MDVLCEMFTHALHSKILVGIPLGQFGSKYNLHYADDQLIITKGGFAYFNHERGGGGS